MDNANPAEAEKLFEGIPWEAWAELSATQEALNKYHGMDGVMRHWATMYDWDDNDGWTLKRKNE